MLPSGHGPFLFFSAPDDGLLLELCEAWQLSFYTDDHRLEKMGKRIFATIGDLGKIRAVEKGLLPAEMGPDSPLFIQVINSSIAREGANRRGDKAVAQFEERLFDVRLEPAISSRSRPRM